MHNIFPQMHIRAFPTEIQNHICTLQEVLTIRVSDAQVMIISLNVFICFMVQVDMSVILCI